MQIHKHICRIISESQRNPSSSSPYLTKIFSSELLTMGHFSVHCEKLLQGRTMLKHLIPLTFIKILDLYMNVPSQFPLIKEPNPNFLPVHAIYYLSVALPHLNFIYTTLHNVHHGPSTLVLVIYTCTKLHSFQCLLFLLVLTPPSVFFPMSQIFPQM